MSMEDDTRPRFFSVEAGLTGPYGSLWYDQVVYPVEYKRSYIFGPIELSPEGKKLTLGELMYWWEEGKPMPKAEERKVPYEKPLTKMGAIEGVNSAVAQLARQRGLEKL